MCACAVVAAPAGADAASPSSTGGSAYTPPPAPAKRARLVNGFAIPPKGAPARVKNAIAAANRIVRKTYIYGGGHSPYPKGVRASAARLERGYDCSGTISFALYGGRLLSSPLDSSSFMSWGRRGKGRWITIYTKPSHAYVVIAGLRLDTSAGDRSTPQERRSGKGPRWRKYSRSSAGYTIRHPKNF